MKRKYVFWCFVAVTASLCAACESPQQDYKKRLDVELGTSPQLEFRRYEEVLFNLDTARFQEELMDIQDQYWTFLDGDLTHPQAVQYLKGFAVDPMSVTLYHKVKEAYPELDGINEIVSSAYRHFNYYYPEITLPTLVYTCVSGIDPEVPSVIFFDDALVIALDWYLENDEVYARIGMPKYRAQRIRKVGLAKDLGQQLYVTYVQHNRKRHSLMEEMVEAGKMDFFAEAMCPSLNDEVLLGYTPQQLRWAEEYEGDLWADMVGTQCLFSSDLEVYRTFLADGPFTNEYSHDAPARLGEFVGLRIIRAYMDSHPDVSLRELMDDDDLQAIFQDSKYKPKK